MAPTRYLMSRENKMSVEVIVPTRDQPINELFLGISANTPPVTGRRIIKDTGQGQTKIRYTGAKESDADYVLLLDDDVYMRPGLVQKYLDKIQEGFDAVCGNTYPAPTGPFGKYVTRYMTNPKTPFYAIGCTLWRTEKFVQIMEEVGVNINKLLGDNLLQKQIIESGKYKVIRVEDAICDHMTYVTAKSFFKKRIVYGVAIGELAKKEKRFVITYLKFLFGIVKWEGRGTFLYRVATFIGMTKYLLRGKQ